MEREPLFRLDRSGGFWEKFRSHYLSVRSKVGLGLQARLPRVQLGHIEHMQMSWRGLWD